MKNFKSYLRINEVSLGTYKQDAEKQVKELKPHTKGEYGDIAKRMIDRRKKGLARAKLRETAEVSGLENLLGPKATEANDKREIERQKKHLTQKAKENHDQSAREGGGGAAQAKGDSFENAKKAIHSEETVKEGLADDIVKLAHARGMKTARVVTTAQKKKETEDLLKKRAEHAKANPQPPRQHAAYHDKYPLGGYDPISHRSYSEEVENVNEDGVMGAAPTNSVAGVAGSGDSRLPSGQREPGVSKKRNPALKGMFTRKPPKV